MREYKDQIQYFRVVNGAGGDGGVEADSQLKDGTFIGVQAKWFLDPLNTSRIGQTVHQYAKQEKFVQKLLDTFSVSPETLQMRPKRKNIRKENNGPISSK